MSPRKKAVPAVSDEDEAILLELRERYEYAKTQWDPVLAEGATDMDYIGGNTWSDEDLKSRVGRLSLNFDQLSQYLNQLVNAIRQNKRAVKVDPDGNGATDKTAEVRANRIRQIEYLSNAQEAYTAAFSGAAERGYGYCRIVAQREGIKSFSKALRLKAIPNPDQVLPDFDAQSVTGRDWKYLFFRYPMTRAEFKRDHPNALYGDFDADTMRGLAEWGDERHVTVCEYWRVVTSKRWLVEFGVPGQTVTVWEDDLDKAREGAPPDAGIIQREQVDAPVVEQYLTNGVELLDVVGDKKRAEWKGSTIPFIACYGKILYKNQGGPDGIVKKVFQSFIRLARDAQKYYNWIKSGEGEVLSMPAKTSYMGYVGQFDADNLALLERSTTQIVPVILAKPTTTATGDTVLPLPRRELPEPPVQAFEIAAEAARRDIQNALGRYSASVGRADTNVKSGVALKQLDQQSDEGSFHFVDNFDAMVTEVGVKLEELLPFYDDTAKTISTRTASGQTKMVRVNDPTATDENGQPAHLPMDVGTHVTTISTGPSFDSEREEASAFADLLIGNPEIAHVLGPQKMAELLALAVKLKNVGPLGDEMAEVINPQDQTNPQQMKQALGQMQAQLKQAGDALAQAHMEIATKQADNAMRWQIAQLDNSTKASIEEQDRAFKASEAQKDRAAKIEIARIEAAKQAADAAAEAREEAMALGFQHAQEMMLAAHAASTAADAQAAQQQHEQTQQQSAQDATAQQQEPDDTEPAEPEPEPEPIAPPVIHVHKRIERDAQGRIAAIHETHMTGDGAPA